MNPQDMVEEFHRTYGQPVRKSPTHHIPETQHDFRIELIREELEELVEAVTGEDATVSIERVPTFFPDVVGIADALADLIYVVYGAAHFYGIDLDEVVTEVHRSNMSKLGPDGQPIFREDGKVLKGPDYFKPDIESVLEGQTE